MRIFFSFTCSRNCHSFFSISSIHLYFFTKLSGLSNSISSFSHALLILALSMISTSCTPAGRPCSYQKEIPYITRRHIGTYIPEATEYFSFIYNDFVKLTSSAYELMLTHMHCLCENYFIYYHVFL